MNANENFVSKYEKMNWKLVLVIRFTLFTACSALKAKSRNYAMEKQRIIVSNETLISITTVFSDIACAQQCLCTATCCSASYEIETKKCLLNSCCNPEIQPSENGIFIQKTGISIREEECIETSGFIYNASADICYYTGPEIDMHFTYINALCPLMGSKLIAIDSQVKQIFVQEILVSDNSPYVCIQGNNKNLDLQYRFDDGLEMTFFNWDELQPQYPTTDHYIILRKSTSYKWHDVPNERSDLKCTFICEK